MNQTLEKESKIRLMIITERFLSTMKLFAKRRESRGTAVLEETVTDEGPADSHPNWFVARTRPISLPTYGSLKRNSPRQLSRQQSDYREKFDDTTLFYDSFSTPEGIRLVGPPLLNLVVDLGKAVVSDNEGRPVNLELNELDRLQSAIVRNSDAGFLNIRSGAVNLGFQPNDHHLHTFEGRRVLLTTSKNNRLEWIRDWVQFHVLHHGIDAVLFYDNGSTDYACEDILLALEGISGLEKAVVVDWPFKYGPRGGDLGEFGKVSWDSDFCQYGSLEHARRRFLERAEAVLNHDVDELAMTDSGETVIELLEESPTGMVSYSGRWIESVGSPAAEIPRFTDYLHYDKTREQGTVKWAISPLRTGHAIQWRVHDVVGIEGTNPGGLLHRHFMGINFNWKYDRTADLPHDKERHVLDEELKAALDSLAQAFDPRPDFSRPVSVLERIEASLVFTKEYPRPRVWFYRDDVLVVEYRLPGFAVAFDVATKGAAISLTVVGRDATSVARLALAYADPKNAKPMSPGRWFVDSIALDSEADVIAGIIETQLGLVLEASCD